MSERYDILEEMRGRIAVAALAASVLGVMAACGSTAGTDPTTDGGTPGEDSGPAEAAPQEDSAATDAGVDVVADAKPDVKLEAGGPSFCAGLSKKPKFCDDFDDGDLSNDWAFTNVLGGSAAGIDVSSFASAPYSMGVVTPALANMQSGPAHVRQTLLATAKHPSLSFSAYFVSDPAVTKGALAIAALDVSLDHFFTLYLRDSPQDGVSTPAAVLEEIEGGTITRYPLAALPPMGAWTRIVIDVDLDAAKLNVTFGAVKVIDDQTIGTSGGTEATFRIGAVYLFGPSDKFEARFDDVVVDF